MPTLIGRALTTRQGTLTPPNQGGAALVLSGYSFSAFGGTSIIVELANNYEFFAFGFGGGERIGAELVLSTPYPFTARSGGRVDALEFSGYGFSSTGTPENIGHFNKTLSGYVFSCTGTTDLVGRIVLVHFGRYALASLGGGIARLEHGGRYPLNGVGVRNNIGGVDADLPRPLFIATGYGDNLGQVEGELPTLIVTSNGVVIGTLPRATISISGSQVIVEYEAYSFTLLEAGDAKKTFATRYTTYPFDRMLRFGNKHYGVSTDGLYELDGDTFDGAPIVAAWQSPPHDFRTREVKRPVSLYVAGRVGGDFLVTVTAAETTSHQYKYRIVNKTGARNYRVLLGKGIRARYLAYGFTNPNGEDFEVDDMTFEIMVSERRTA